MNKLIIPNYYYQNIHSINYNKLKENKIKCLLFDIDNTIKDDRGKTPDNKDIELFNRLKKDFKIILVSNALPSRVSKFANALDIEGYGLACKPLKYTYNKIIKKHKLNTNNIAAIGDRLYTDIKGANKLNITSILVDRISKYENLIPKIDRLRENRVINKYRFIERGKYND